MSVRGPRTIVIITEKDFTWYHVQATPKELMDHVDKLVEVAGDDWIDWQAFDGHVGTKGEVEA